MKTKSNKTGKIDKVKAQCVSLSFKSIFLASFLLFTFLLFTSFIQAEEFGYNYLEGDLDQIQAINYSQINVNNSQFLRGYSPTTLRDSFETYFNNIYCELTGCEITGNVTALNFIGGNGFFDNIFTKEETEDLFGGASIDLYFHNFISDIGGYYIMNRTANNYPKAQFTQTITTNEQLLGSFISTNVSEFGITGLRAGVYDAHFHGNATLGANYDVVSGYYKVYKRLNNGTEIYITTSELEEVASSSPDEYVTHAVITGDVDFNYTDRLVIKLYANITEPRATRSDVSFQIDGDTTSGFQFNVQGVSFATLRDLEDYVPYTGGTTDLNLSSNTGLFGWLGSLTNKITKIFTQDIEISGKLNLTNGSYSNQIYTDENGTLTFYIE